MKRTTIFIDESLERDLQILARRRTKPVAAVVREAIAHYVREQKSPVTLRFQGIARSGRHDTAERHEELLWRDLRPHIPSSRAGRSKRLPTATPSRRGRTR